MTDLAFTVTVGGTVVPFTKFRMTGGAYGSVGHVSIHTSGVALLDAKIDLFALASGAPGFLEVTIAVQQSPTEQPAYGGYGSGGLPASSSATTRIFGGEFLRTDFDMDADEVCIHARDWAGVLIDQRRILTKIGKVVMEVFAPLAPGRVTAAGISNENQKISDVVTSIAEEFGFTPVLNLSSSGKNPTVGTLYGSADQSFFTIPMSLWTVLNQLARDTGYVCYVTPQKQLVFGEPGAGLETLQFSWNATPGQGQLPCKHLRIEHHPRRNSTFRVLVISYDPGKGQTTLGRATYIGNAFAGQNGLKAGMNVAQDAVAADASILGLRLGETSSLPVESALPLISQYESGNQNVANSSGPGGTAASTASGYYQIINGTWAQFAPQAGVSVAQYPTAMSAPRDAQTAVATKIYEQQGIGPWSSNTKLLAAVGSGGLQGGFNVNNIPLYTFNVDGMSSEQATLKAESIATDIAKRELILSMTVDGLPSILPTQKIRISGDLLPTFVEPIFYVSGYEQTFTLPRPGHHSSSAGWVTNIQALNIPTEGLARGPEG